MRDFIHECWLSLLNVCRFAQFFLCPLFDESCKDREVNAVDSEHEKNLMNDAWRLFQLEKATGNPKHPFSKFGTGRKTPIIHSSVPPTYCMLGSRGLPVKQGIRSPGLPGSPCSCPWALGTDSWVKDGPVGADVSVWRLNKCSRVYLHEQPLTLHMVWILTFL